jgi:tight adherence protein B
MGRNRLNVLLSILIILVSILLPILAFAQEPQDILIKKFIPDDFPQINIYLNFREGSELGSQELTLDNFTVQENGSAVKDLSVNTIAQISEPIGVVLALDTSGSMIGEPVADAQSAAILFMDEMRKIDRFAVVGFADSVTVYSKFTSDRTRLKDSISQTVAWGETSLFDGLMVALDQFKDQEDMKHRYVIVLSDGMDTVSKLKVDDVIAKAKAENVTVYSIALLSYDFNPVDIGNISKSTEGELLVAARSSELKELYKSISRKMRNQYKISYISLWPNTENIDVTVNVKSGELSSSASVTYKNPYYAPAPTKIVMSPQLPFYLALFNIWWMKMIVYAAFFISISLLLYIFALLMFPSKKILKQRTEIYGYKTPQRSLEDEIRHKKGRIGFVDHFVIFISKIAARRGFLDLFDIRLERAGMSIQSSEFVSLHVAAVIICAISLYILSRSILLTSAVTFLVVIGPFLILSFKTASRMRKFHDQLPDTLQLISGSLKTGYSFNQSLSTVVDETTPPISDEFKRVLSEIRMGLAEKDALDNMAARLNSEHFNWAVMSINIQREVGGNLAEVLEIISSTIRERDRAMRQIKALTAEGRLSAYILIGLPILFAGALTLLNREYISLLVTTRVGIVMLSLASLLMIIGIIWIIRIVRVEY